jgi:hypothetical protein
MVTPWGRVLAEIVLEHRLGDHDESECPPLLHCMPRQVRMLLVVQTQSGRDPPSQDGRHSHERTGGLW